MPFIGYIVHIELLAQLLAVPWYFFTVFMHIAYTEWVFYKPSDPNIVWHKLIVHILLM